MREPTTVVTSPEEAPARSLSVRGNTLVASTSGLISGVLNAAMLTLSARTGQTGEIAAYTVMTGALAWVSTVMAGGSSLLYLSGTETERNAVRSQRLLVTVPAMVLATLCVALVYHDRGYDWRALAAVGVVSIGNSLFELQSGDLARQMRFLAGTVAICGTKAVALGFIAAGVSLTAALAAVSVAQFVIMETVLCRGPVARPPIWHQLSPRAGLRAFRHSRHLFVYNGAEVFTGRAAGLALSMVASAQVVGCFGALLSVYQAIVAVLYGGLRVPMALRVRRRRSASPHPGVPTREGETLIVAAAFLTALSLVVAAPWITDDLLQVPVPGGALTLQLLALALPFLTINRAISLNRIGDGDYRGATRVAALIAVFTALALGVQWTGLGSAGAAATAVVAEASTLAVLCAHAALRTRLHGRRLGVRP